ncbi:PQQ-dependent sugar dehydrogenase [Amycolatopsis aidingensis]|uniref:PQQ-dependent sugar dehydrogenase n=1 Tax=Amycolatopsis aidingensis TaxID=2842453 RepID=UPI001C0BEBCC|nr:PQQ-dependent sugar dehydrogenase [Amycolatopsis aidingensis]
MRTRFRRNTGWPLALLAGGLLLSSCAEFDDSVAGQTWEPAPQLTPEAGPQPQLPEADGTGAGPATPGAPQTSVPPPEGCTDFDQAVLGTCMDTVAAVAVLPDMSALAGERKSGKVFRTARTQGGPTKKEIATLPVEAAGDGGLTGLALSPSYAEDRLIFAYVTTATDNRVVRFAKGQPVKPILTGIPKGQNGNRGALATDGTGALLVATGDAGDERAAADPNSLAGKVLRIDTTGNPAKGNPTPGSAVLASGLHSPGGLCQSLDGSRRWVTDRGAGKDVIYRIEDGKPLSTPAWTWPDQPGLAGCADTGTLVAIATAEAGNVQLLPVGEDGSVGGEPTTMLDGEESRAYGRLAGMAILNETTAVVGTVNKDGGEPVSSDDRTVVIQIQPSNRGGGRD